MLDALSHLALEVKDLSRARTWYNTELGMEPLAHDDAECRYRVGETAFVLRRPESVPRGGIHTHFAFSIPRGEYDEWFDRLAHLDPEEARFGDARSLYVDDPDGHCVELGDVGGDGTDDEGGEGGAGPSGIFEVVLEVRSLAPAIERYTALGFEVIDRGDERPRARLRGPMDLELWEPHLGIAGARGGVHVDLGFRTPEPAVAVDALGSDALDRTDVPEGLRVRDPDGHHLTFLTG